MTPEIRDLIDESDDVFGGVEGNFIDWTYPGEYLTQAYGIKPEFERPHIGKLLAAEFEDYWVQVEVTNIHFDNPAPGYFLLEVTPTKRILKPKPSAVRMCPQPFRFLRSP